MKLEQTTQDLQRDRNEYLKLIEKSSWLEKQLWQEKQERLKLVGEKEVLSEKRNIDVTKALRIAEENYGIDQEVTYSATVFYCSIIKRFQKKIERISLQH